MSKFATKAAANMFCQARYEAAKSNERLSSREGAAEEIGIDRTRLSSDWKSHGVQPLMAHCKHKRI